MDASPNCEILKFDGLHSAITRHDKEEKRKGFGELTDGDIKKLNWILGEFMNPLQSVPQSQFPYSILSLSLYSHIDE